MSFPLLGQSGGADLSAVEADIATLQTDVASKAETSALTTSINFVTATLNAGLAQKEDLITTGSLAISDVASLQSSLDGKATHNHFWLAGHF